MKYVDIVDIVIDGKLVLGSNYRESLMKNNNMEKCGIIEKE